MPKKEKTRPKSPPPSQIRIDGALRDTWRIRVHMRVERVPQWGLPIIRGSYISQARWDQFIAQFHKDMYDEHLRFEEDTLLQDTMTFPIIEDKKKLHGATWTTARTTFDKWIEKDRVANPLPPSRYPQEQELVCGRMHRAPFWTYCIFVNEASICSVLDYSCDKRWRNISQGDYWFLLIPSIERWLLGCAQHANGKILDEETDRFKKVKVADFVRSYAEITEGYDGFDRLRCRGKDGMCSAL